MAFRGANSVPESFCSSCAACLSLALVWSLQLWACLMPGKRLVLLFYCCERFWCSGKTQLLGCVWFTLWLHPPVGITSEFVRKYCSISQGSAFFGLESVSILTFPWIESESDTAFRFSCLVHLWYVCSSELVRCFCQCRPSAVIFPKTLFALCLSRCPQVAMGFCFKWSLPAGQWEILYLKSDI